MKKEQKLIFRLLPLLIAAVIAALLPQMIRNEYYMTIACQILIYLIAVCGLNFITGLTGQMNLGTAGMFAMGSLRFRSAECEARRFSVARPCGGAVRRHGPSARRSAIRACACAACTSP